MISQNEGLVQPGRRAESLTPAQGHKHSYRRAGSQTQ
jgi:hypothetical protein